MQRAIRAVILMQVFNSIVLSAFFAYLMLIAHGAQWELLLEFNRFGEALIELSWLIVYAVLGVITLFYGWKAMR